MKLLPILIILCFGLTNVISSVGQEKSILVKGSAVDFISDDTVPMILTDREITFESLLGKTYSTKTNLKGEFEILVLAGKYKVKLKLNEFSNQVYENTLIDKTHNYLPIKLNSVPMIETDAIEIEPAEPRIANKISDQPLIKLPERIKIHNSKTNRNNRRVKKFRSLRN